MSPSCRTMPPIICTSKMRWFDSRTRASRTAANASNRMSSSDSPFSSRCRNSTVLPRSSSSESFWNSGSRVAMYAACSASRFNRRPSPKRSAFSRDPRAGISETGYRHPGPSKRRRLDLPEISDEMAGADDVVLALFAAPRARSSAPSRSAAGRRRGGCALPASRRARPPAPRAPEPRRPRSADAATAQSPRSRGPPPRGTAARARRRPRRRTARASPATGRRTPRRPRARAPRPRAPRSARLGAVPFRLDRVTTSNRLARGTPWIPGSPRGSPSNPGG